MTAILIVLIYLASYFLPLWVAMIRHHPSVVGIGLLNFFLGWTVIGWIIAIVWAGSSTVTNTVTIINTVTANAAPVEKPTP